LGKQTILFILLRTNELQPPSDDLSKAPLSYGHIFWKLLPNLP